MFRKTALTLSVLTFCMLWALSFTGGVQGEEYIDTESLISVTVYNDLEYEGYGLEIYYLYMTPTDSEYFSADLMDTSGLYYMGYGDHLTLYLTPGEYDVLAVDEDYDLWYYTYTISGGGATRSSMDLYLDEDEMYFESDGTIFDSTYLEITIGTEASVDYLFLSPTDSEYWGVNIIGDQILEFGDFIEINFGPNSQTTFDMLVVFSDGDQMQMEIDGTLDDSITIVDIPVDDDDDTVIDDDDIVDDDDDTVIDDDDNSTIDDDDDDLPPEQQPGGVPGTGGDVEADEEKEDSNALGFATVVMVIIIACLYFRVKRRRR